MRRRRCPHSGMDGKRRANGAIRGAARMGAGTPAARHAPLPPFPCRVHAGMPPHLEHDPACVSCARPLPAPPFACHARVGPHAEGGARRVVLTPLPCCAATSHLCLRPCVPVYSGCTTPNNRRGIPPCPLLFAPSPNRDAEGDAPPCLRLHLAVPPPPAQEASEPRVRGERWKRWAVVTARAREGQ